MPATQIDSSQVGGLTDADIASGNKDGTAAMPSLRTLGTGAQQSCGGTDSRLSDARVPSGAAGGALSGTYPNPGLVATGVRIDSHRGVLTSDTDGATITFDLTVSDLHTVTLGGNRTLSLANVLTNQAFLIKIIQPATGGPFTVTWFTTIKWAGGTAPTLTTAAGKGDWFQFIQTSAGNFDGFIVGQNF